MTVRLTPSESDSSPSAPVAAPLGLSELPVSTPGSAPFTSDPGSARPGGPGTDVPEATTTGTLGSAAVTDPAMADPLVLDHVEADPVVGGPVVTTPDGADPVVPGAVEVDSTPRPPGAVTADSRVALREARRVRRRTAWLCAAVVALALALTIVVVSLARTRPIPHSSGPVASAATAPILVPSVPTPGATAPDGGTP